MESLNNEDKWIGSDGCTAHPGIEHGTAGAGLLHANKVEALQHLQCPVGGVQRDGFHSSLTDTTLEPLLACLANQDLCVCVRLICM